MNTYRKEKLASALQKKLGEVITKEIELPVGSLATISEVEIREDIKKATAWVSVIPEEKGDEVLKVLERARRYIQHQVGEGIRARVIPRIEFAIDQGAEHAARIEKISLEEKDNS